MTTQEFKEDILRGIPEDLPAPKPYDTSVNHAPKRKDILSPEEKVLALKNALIPIVTVIGMQFAGNLGGAIMCETVFSIPGIGTLMINAISQRNAPMVLACSVLTAVAFSLVTIAVDVLYAFVDPRIKTQYVSKKKKAAQGGTE